MLKAKRKAVIVAALKKGSRARKVRDDGNHEVWHCACGLHHAEVPRHRQISVGVTVKIYKAMVDCPYFGEGWLE